MFVPSTSDIVLLLRDAQAIVDGDTDTDDMFKHLLESSTAQELSNLVASAAVVLLCASVALDASDPLAVVGRWSLAMSTASETLDERYNATIADVKTLLALVTAYVTTEDDPYVMLELHLLDLPSLRNLAEAAPMMVFPALAQVLDNGCDEVFKKMLYGDPETTT